MTSEIAPEDFLDGFLSSAFASEMPTGGAPLHAMRREEEDVPERLGRFPVIERIGIGGMGLVYRVEDPELGRNLAVKVLRRDYVDRKEWIERFQEEPRVCARLTHPGVVAIHEVGELEDGRPYFAMRLVDGATLAALLADRVPGEVSSEHLRVFERMCEIVAYAHDQGVVHGDIKPQNVMVGAFGEVQVMDWGFARDATGDLDRRGCGTPAYMAPEQARDSDESVSPRTDVFGLGATLCEVLTGSPPYLGETRDEVYLRARRAWQDDARVRLHAATSEPELADLAERCMSPDPEDRPENASAVAREIVEYRTRLAERARRLEIEAAAARARATEERRARLLTLALSVTLVGVAIAVAGTFVWFQRDALARTIEVQTSVERALSSARSARENGRLGGEFEESHWQAAASAARQALALAASRDAASDLAARITADAKQIAAEAERAIGSLRLSQRLQELRPHAGDERKSIDLDRSYAEAFAAVGLDVMEPIEHVAERLMQSRDPDLLIGSLDQWAHFRRMRGMLEWRRIHEIARASDSDPWRRQLREAYERNDRSALRRIARGLDPSAHSPLSLDLLASCLRNLGELDRAIEVYRSAVRAYPEDYQLTHNLAAQLETLDEPPREEVERLSWAGVALRPRSAHALTDLGLVLLERGDLAGSLEFLDRSDAIRPGHPRNALVRGVTLTRLGRLVEAETAMRIAAEGGYDDMWVTCGELAASLLRVDEAVVAMQRAVEASPGDVGVAFQHARILCVARRTHEGIAALEAVLQQDPEHAEAYCNLGNAYLTVGRFDDAVAALRQGDAIGRARGPERWQYPSDVWVERAESFLQLGHLLDTEVEDGGATCSAAERIQLGAVALRRGEDARAMRLIESGLNDADLPDTVPLTGAWMDLGIAAARRAGDRGVEMAQEARRTLQQHALDAFDSWVFELQCAFEDAPTLAALAALGVAVWRGDPAVRQLRDDLGEITDAQVTIEGIDDAVQALIDEALATASR